MRLEIQLKNYRCFPVDEPARFSITDGFTAVVGPNNAGKSSLLRFFYEFRPYWQRMGRGSGNMLNAINVRDAPPGFLGLRDNDEVFSNLNGRGIEVRFRLDHDYEQPPDTPLGEQYLPTPQELQMTVERNGEWSLRIVDPANPLTSTDIQWSETVLVQGGTPALEFAPWLEVFETLGNALYIGPFRNALNTGAQSYYDMSIGTAFIQEWNNFRSGPTKAQNVAALQVTTEIQRIFGLNSLDITATADDTTLQLVVDGQPYHLGEVGGGLTHFILVLAYAATRGPGLMLIDEPELNLHPSLQLDFLATVGSYASKGVFFATHSLGLARAAGADVYAVRRVGSGRSEVRPLDGVPRLAEFLGELSLSGYQELGFNKVLMVEGPTDVTVVQRLLRLYGIEHEIVLLPLGGGELINAGVERQLSEVLRLTPNVFALIDSEREEAGADLQGSRAEFVRICSELGIRCHVLERRAIENYFTGNAVKAVKGEKFRNLEPFERLRDLQPAWSKVENWKIAGKLTEPELAETDLGEFLSELAS